MPLARTAVGRRARAGVRTWTQASRDQTRDQARGQARGQGTWAERKYAESLAVIAADLRAMAELDDSVQRRVWANAYRSMLAPVNELTVSERGERMVRALQRRFLDVDPHPGGGAVEVVGDLEDARHVVVLVAGMRNSLGTLDGARDIACRVRAEAGPDTAVVLWHRYRFPNRAQALSPYRAAEAAPRLRAFVNDLRDHLPHADVTVSGFSYGSVVVGLALREGMRCDRAVLAGSPGVAPDIDRAADLAGDVAVFTAREPWDVVAGSRWFGPDPSGFPDAVRMRTSRPGHQGYWTPGSEFLANLGRVARGDLDAVTRADDVPVRLDRALAPARRAARTAAMAGTVGAIGAAQLSAAARRRLGQIREQRTGARTAVT